MNGDPIARASEDCTCLRSGYSHSYACRERLIDRQRAEIEQLTRERDAMQRRAESAEADWMALSQDDGKVERALERSEQENDRLRALLSEVLPQHVDQPRGWSGEWNGSEENTWVGRVRAELSGEHSAHETTGELQVTDDQIKHMVNRFLGWRLPANFSPDAGISFQPEYNVEYNAAQGKPPDRHEPSGTNLFDAVQAEALVRYMIQGMPGSSEKADGERS